MTPRISQDPGHLELARLWDFATGQLELSLGELAHVLNCDECATALSACFQRIFVLALQELQDD